MRRVILLRYPRHLQLLSLGLLGLHLLAHCIVATERRLLTVIIVCLHTQTGIRRFLPQLLGEAHHILPLRRNIIM